MNAFRSFLSGLSRRAKWAFAVGVLAILIVTGVAMWWALRPEYTLLVGNLKPADASEIASALSGWGVPYQFGSGDQSILVPDGEVYTTRMKLAAQGIPKGGDVGFSAFKSSDYGVTEFAQQVNYQLALQGELERTIDSMQQVASSRVHLTIQHAELFQKNQQPSKASVTLHLRPGYELAAAQVMGIQRLVASAVAGLAPGAVTVLNQDGTVLSTSGGDGVAAQSADATQLEKTIRAQVTSLLFGVLHRRDFTVSVAVQLNYDKVKRVQERLLAQGKGGNGLLVHERTDSTRSTGSPSSSDQASGGTVTSRDVQYAHGTLQEEIDEAPGRIQRISVGVVVPDVLSPKEIETLSNVISAGVGLDSSRGDHIDIAAIVPTAGNKAETNQTPSMAAAYAPFTATSPNAGNVSTLHRWLSMPVLIGVATIVLLVLLLFVWQARQLLRSSEPRRLSKAERAATLERLVEWIGKPERTP